MWSYQFIWYFFFWTSKNLWTFQYCFHLIFSKILRIFLFNIKFIFDSLKNIKKKKKTVESTQQRLTWKCTRRSWFNLFFKKKSVSAQLFWRFNQIMKIYYNPMSVIAVLHCVIPISWEMFKFCNILRSKPEKTMDFSNCVFIFTLFRECECLVKLPRHCIWSV